MQARTNHHGTSHQSRAAAIVRAMPAASTRIATAPSPSVIAGSASSGASGAASAAASGRPRDSRSSTVFVESAIAREISTM